MTDVKLSPKGAWAYFDDMAWPVPSERVARAQWALRNGKPSRMDLLLAASIIAAYRQMVTDPRTKREHVIRALRKVMK